MNFDLKDGKSNKILQKFVRADAIDIEAIEN